MPLRLPYLYLGVKLNFTALFWAVFLKKGLKMQISILHMSLLLNAFYAILALSFFAIKSIFAGLDLFAK